MSVYILILHAYTPIHQGIGQVPAPVDLPIAREKPSGYPIIRHMKGPIRAFLENMKGNNNDNDIKKWFGSSPEGGTDEDASAGSVIFSDAYLLLFPVRSAKRGIVWLSSPYIVDRFLRHKRLLCGGRYNKTLLRDSDMKDGKIYFIDKGIQNNYDIIEGYEVSEEILELPSDIKQMFNIIVDSVEGIDMSYIALTTNATFSFIVENFTEIVPRIRIGESGTVEEGPWWEENIPAETVFYMWIQDRKENSDIPRLIEKISGKFIDVGGNITLGRGKVKVIEFEDCLGGDQNGQR